MSTPCPASPDATEGRPGPNTRSYIPTLDGWRALAIIGVLTCHGLTVPFVEPGAFHSMRVASYLFHGNYGVDIFFALSGFLITGRLISERNATGRIDFRAFYIRRAFRILPAYWSYLATLAIVTALMPRIVVTGREWTTCLLFVRDFLSIPQTISRGWYTTHFWTLAIEEHFYVIWPSLIALLGYRRAPACAAIIVCTVALWRALDGALIGRWLPPGAVRIDSLLWGGVFALLFPRLRSSTLITARPALCAGIMSAVALLCLVGATGTLPAGPILLPPLTACLVTMTVLRPTSLFSRFLELASLRWLGRLSYSLYLWQQLFLPMGDSPRPLPLGAAQRLPINILLALVAGVASHFLLERPLMAAGSRFASRTARHTSTVLPL